MSNKKVTSNNTLVINVNLEKNTITLAPNKKAFLLFAESLWPEARDKNGGYIRTIFDKVFRPRTTGEGSHNHAINGYIQQICVATGVDEFKEFEYLKMYAKFRAIPMGYSYDTMPGGEVAPWSESRASVEDALILIKAIVMIADEEGIILKEE